MYIIKNLPAVKPLFLKITLCLLLHF